MSRIRNIKPGFFTDETITELDRDVRLFFIGLWTECDKHGVFEWKPKQLRIRLFSCELDFTNETIAGFMETLLLVDFVRKFDHKGEPFGWVVHFQEHQWISKSESEKGAMLAPVPKRWPQKKLPGTGLAPAMGVTTDSGLHIRTMDGGQGTQDTPPAGAGADPPPAISGKGKTGRTEGERMLRKILAEYSLSNNNTDISEWAGALMVRAKIQKNETEVRAFFGWAEPIMRKAFPEGPLHLRHSGTLTDEWPANKKKVMEGTAA